jgi:DNA or RNA helicases of superfamily II
VIAHRTELLAQAKEKLEVVTGCSVGTVKNGVKPAYNALIQVISIQSLRSRLKRLREPSLIIVDEAHHSTASTYKSSI